MKIETLINFTFIFLLGAILGARFLPPKTPEPIYQQSDICIRAIPDLEEWYYVELRGRIIDCESEGDITAKNPNSTAYGLCQFLDGTWIYCEKKWDMDLDRKSKEDQLYACDRLLKEEGLKHWKPVWSCIGYKK